MRRGCDIQSSSRAISKRRGDDGFAVGARIERRGRDGKGAAIEVPDAEDARHGLVLLAPLHIRLQKLELSGGQHPLRRPQQIGARNAESPRSEAADIAARPLDAGARKLPGQVPHRRARR